MTEEAISLYFLKLFIKAEANFKVKASYSYLLSQESLGNKISVLTPGHSFGI